MPPATPQPQPHQHQHQPQQQQSGQLRRMTSFTQRFRSSKPASTAAHVESATQAQQDQTRPRTFYVPTHAASSFARTVSPLSRTRIDERDELEHACEEPSRPASGLGTRSTPRKNHAHAHARTNSTPSTNSMNPVAVRNDSSDPVPLQRASTTRKSDLDTSSSNDYATFLAQAQANDRAFRTRWAQREREREREWASSHLAGLPQSFKGTQRDSAYYSVGSLSRSSMSGSGPQKQQVVHERFSAPIHGDSTPRTLNQKPSRTLGRRISEYFKPTPEGGVTVA
ncbi:hypothetical protein VFPPC_13419 [Pochonia chlamydosporia 170]|uniref:Uncharacterized protein n=1 Tax=Pochonia chlamydosporia 170 TaxID=1380566 RepID=A0A179G029_METCM|nr:hypothetical protein VFPPC_13419 [Pochonia chlamydosporia 170]OAQ70790.1 hypothetical protein VFPPC_13419 [Pochonia chlamydosporia 170]